MVEAILFVLTLVSALGCGLMAGVYFAFAAVVMDALARLPPAQGMAAMQAINAAALRPAFLAASSGTAAACALLVGTSLLRWHEPATIPRLVDGVLYLIGGLGVTIACNVPRDATLAAVAADSAEGPASWARFFPGSTGWNHVRAAAALAAAAALTLALC